MIGTTFSARTQRARRILLAAGVLLTMVAAPARASCPANAIGIAHSDGAAAVADPAATPPAWGQPADAGIGHKVG